VAVSSALTYVYEMKIPVKYLISVSFILLLFFASLIVHNTYAQQGGAASGGTGQTNQGTGMTITCTVNNACIITGNSATGGSATGGNAIGSGNGGNSDIQNEQSQMLNNSIIDKNSLSSSLLCGQVITTSVKLSSNLDCASDGLLVQGDNIVIDLNGHTIKGPGPSASKIGISVADNNGVQITGSGTIEGFQAGVLASGGSKDTITDVNFNGNQIAIFLTGTTGADIQNNMITNNQIGMAAHSSTSTTFKKNVLTENDLTGVTLVNSGNNSIDSNTIKKSKNGVFNDAQSVGNSITSNTLMENSGVDLNNGNGIPINVNDATFTGNLCQTSVPDSLCTTGQ
jgi:parallel beta-helix repeat protein